MPSLRVMAAATSFQPLLFAPPRSRGLVLDTVSAAAALPLVAVRGAAVLVVQPFVEVMDTVTALLEGIT